LCKIAEIRERVQRLTYYVRFGIELDLLGISACAAVYFSSSWLAQFGITETAAELSALILVLPILWACAWWIVKGFLNQSFSCPYCRKSIPVIHQWECGHCHHEMRLSAFLWTVFRLCFRCRNSAEYLKCPHCDVPIALVKDADPGVIPVCARYVADTELLVYPSMESELSAPPIPEGFEQKSGPPLVVAWRRAGDDNVIIWWTRVGHTGFQVRGCRYPRVPTAPNELDGHAIMAPSGALTDKVDVGVSVGRHGNFGFWLERKGFQPTGFVGFGVPPGAAAPVPAQPDPHEERRKMNRSTLSLIHDIQREWREAIERLHGELERGELLRDEHERMTEITDQLYENQINVLTGPERV
jgi:hypothetical protein